MLNFNSNIVLKYLVFKFIVYGVNLSFAITT